MKIAISIALLMGLISFVDLHDVWLKLQHADIAYVAAAILCLLMAYCLCGLRWAWMAEGLGMQINRWRKQQLLFLGLFVSLFMPTTIGGDFVRGLLMGRGRKEQKWSAYASVFLDRLNGFFALILLLIACLYFVEIPRQWLLFSLAIAFFIWLTLAIYPWIHKRLPDKFSKWRDLPLNSKAFVGSWWQCLLMSMLILVLVIQTHVFLGMAVGMNLSWQAYGVMVTLVALASVLPISFNGFGIREAGYVGIATYFAAETSNAAAMAGLWAILIYICALPGYIALIKIGGFGVLRKRSRSD